MLSVRRAEGFCSYLSLFQLGRQVWFLTVLRLLWLMASMIAVIPLGLLFSEHWSECHATFKKTSDNNAMVHLSSDPLGNPRSVDRRNSSGQSYVVMTDASLHGWGALYQGSSVRREWSTVLKECHINCLELQVVLLAWKHFAQRLQGKHVLVRMDNTTVMTYIN